MKRGKGGGEGKGHLKLGAALVELFPQVVAIFAHRCHLHRKALPR